MAEEQGLEGLEGLGTTRILFPIFHLVNVSLGRSRPFIHYLYVGDGSATRVFSSSHQEKI